MALSSIKLSTSMMRPFVFSFNRANCNLLASSSGPIIAPSSSRPYTNTHQYLSTNRQSLTCGGHMRTLSRPISNDASSKQQQQQDSVIYDNKDINNSSSLRAEATLLAKSSDRDSDSSSEDPSRPTEGHLQIIADKMAEHLPTFFKRPHDFRMYNKSIVFEDNIRNIRTAGLSAYAWQIALIKMGAHFKYGKVTLTALKITKHIEDGTVRIRWRIETFPGNSIVFVFWKFKLWNTRESYDEHKDEWIDGFSIFHVGGDGLIYKHICDKVIPDTNKAEPKKSTNLAMKLGLALGLIPGGSGGEHFADDLLTKIYEILSSF